MSDKRPTLDEIASDFNKLAADRDVLLAACEHALETEQGRDRPCGWTIEVLMRAIAFARSR